MALPTIPLKTKNTIHGFPTDGDLLYEYKPLQNLKKDPNNNGEIDVSGLTLSAKTANIDINKPIFLDTEVSFDDSVNIIINDYSNPLKIVNSRFYLIDANTYKIADREGNVDTNLYTEVDFKIEAGLIKTVRSVVTLDFLGIKNGGKMPVGTYNFYFKLADSDGNETDFISESGKVVCHIGTINHPQSIRGGQMDEDSNKLIKFKLNNLDLAYDYVNIYYTRSSGDGISEYTKSYKIADKFKIRGTSTEVSITGYEIHEEIDNSEINIQYTTFDAVKTTDNCQNITFAGNVDKNYELFKTLEKYSLFVIPELTYDKHIGNLNYNYSEAFTSEGYEYYNMNNVYYKLGYWDQDIYRFGIVYILNDYTLSPVFSIRGIQELRYDSNPTDPNNSLFYKKYNRDSELNFEEDFILEESNDPNNRENSKGIFKIVGNTSGTTTFDGNKEIKPIGIKFNFRYNVLTEGGQYKEPSIIEDTAAGAPGLKSLTKGFFIVRQKRIPTILTQALAIATADKSYTPVLHGTYDTGATNYFSEAFLKIDAVSGKPALGKSYFPIVASEIALATSNALICPDASLKTSLYNNYFNSSEFLLKKANFKAQIKSFNKYNDIFYLGALVGNDESTEQVSNLLLVEPGTELINNESVKFSSRAGHPMSVEKHADPIFGDIFNYNDSTENDTSLEVGKIRGDFNTYLGSTESLDFGQHYNIFQKGYDFSNNWKEYFRIRYNDSSAFMPVSDRFSWNDITNNITEAQYRGDCYINTYSHRMIWNFVDPELPSNTKILDKYTWYKNYKVKRVSSTVVFDGSDANTTISYNKILPLFTYKKDFVLSWAGDVTDSNEPSPGILEPDAKKFNKYSEANGVFGYTKINRPDVNAVPIGHWAVFKICSNVNTALRDLDFTNPEEEAIHKYKRGFYPLQSAESTNRLPESNVINQGISKSLGDKYYFEIPDVPFIKTNFSNRIYYSEILQEYSFKNGNRVFQAKNYQDYSREYGAIVKLIEWYGKLICVMEHGVIMIPVNERAMMTNAQGENVYINTENVLPKNPVVLSNTYGSVWEDAIVRTPRFIYGLDTIGKKVWRTNGETFELISDLKIQKFLNDNISLKIVDQKRIPGTHSIKAHYNAFKFDVMFVFVYNGVSWNLCWNELLNKWTTQYTWFPEFSENINNIFYTFANNQLHSAKGNILYKHGFAGGVEESGTINPTMWYDTQKSFEFEVVVIGVQGVQKIFDNLKIISNLTAPDSFYYEIVGEGFDWKSYKNTILSLSDFSLMVVEGAAMPARGIGETDLDYLKRRYKYYLLEKPQVKKLPFIYINGFDSTDLKSIINNQLITEETILKDLTIEQNNKTRENLVISYQKGIDIKTNGRLKGNMQYVEDSWDIQIQPISFKWAYLNNSTLALSNYEDMRIRDKYIKIRVKYDGQNYAIVNALKTLFTISYA